MGCSHLAVIAPAEPTFFSFNVSFRSELIKPVFHYTNLFARREAKTVIRHRNWSAKKPVANHVAELVVRANKFA